MRNYKRPMSEKKALDKTNEDSSHPIKDVPSVTQLLNRKSLNLTSKVQETPHENIPAPQAEFKTEEGISLDLNVDQSFQLETTGGPGKHHTPTPAQTSSVLAPVKIQPASRRQRPAQKLIVWDLNQLKNGNDPLGRGIFEALSKKGVGALFLAIQPAASGTSIPTFSSTAAVLAPQKHTIWTGLKWDPTIVPEMWNHFIKTGWIELSPPGSFTNIASNRNVVRAAFGIQQSEWLLLICVGTRAQCRGVVAIVTTRSIATEIGPICTLIGTPVPSPKSSP